MVTKTFQVVTLSLNVRVEPGTEPRLLLPNLKLSLGQQVIAEAASRTEADGFVWWKHSAGWSAERTLDGKRVFMSEVVPAEKAAAVVEAAKTEQAPPPPPPDDDDEVDSDGDGIPDSEEKIVFHVVATINVRREPDTSAAKAGVGLPVGRRLTVDANSRTVNDGLVWWKHSGGWSVERTEDGRQVFMVLEKPDLPRKGLIFERLPVSLDDTRWFYYYGNTVYAFRFGGTDTHRYDSYSQGLHGGLDFGHPGGATVVAGVHGVFDGFGRSFGPNRYDVLVGKYRIIYGHLEKPNMSLVKGQPITPDTVLGVTSFSRDHMHLEIRESEQLILNPLLFFPEEMRVALIEKFPPVGDFAFYKDATWDKWTVPLDQPTITLGGPLIGPRAKR
jgi:murein DD-endopeptidase MepM/ murein hydrolase activator NlpD